jgi:hypothetical protein
MAHFTLTGHIHARQSCARRDPISGTVLVVDSCLRRNDGAICPLVNVRML